jgi:hypothetical protein
VSSPAPSCPSWTLWLTTKGTKSTKLTLLLVASLHCLDLHDAQTSPQLGREGEAGRLDAGARTGIIEPGADEARLVGADDNGAPLRRREKEGADDLGILRPHAVVITTGAGKRGAEIGKRLLIELEVLGIADGFRFWVCVSSGDKAALDPAPGGPSQFPSRALVTASK